MNKELKQLAALALRNAFWHDFSALVNTYLEASKGLDIDEQEMMMGELTSIYGRDDTATFPELDLDIWSATYDHIGRYIPKDHTTLVKALNQKYAEEVHLRGKKVFEKRDGDWYFVEEYLSKPLVKY